MSTSLTVLQHFSAACHEMATLTVNQMFLMLEKPLLGIFTKSICAEVQIILDTVTFLWDSHTRTKLTGD